MIRGTYASTAGMAAMMARAETIANNLANVETTGFKEDTLQLTTPAARPLVRLYDAATAGGGQQAAAPEVGSMAFGVLPSGTTVRYAQGSLKTSDNPLDVALQGAGFFAVQTPDGLRYTRDGSFRRDADNGLVTGQGDRVVGPAGQPIDVPAGEVAVTSDGQIMVDGAPAGQLGVFDFADPGALRKTSGNQFAALPGSAAPVAAAAATVHQGFLEGSNVDPTHAMADLLVAQRAYEAGARLVQIQDEMTGRAVNDIGRI